MASNTKFIQTWMEEVEKFNSRAQELQSLNLRNFQNDSGLGSISKNLTPLMDAEFTKNMTDKIRQSSIRRKSEKRSSLRESDPSKFAKNVRKISAF
jgi:hypothetical protein